MTIVFGVTRRTLLRGLAAVLALAAAGLAPLSAVAEDKGPVVFAAASLKNALDGVNAAWKKESGKEATISYAASSSLAKQIEHGAPADIFISADEDWMDYLAERKLIKPATRFNLLANTLVLIAPKESTLAATIAPSFPFASLLGDGRLAVANVDSAPAGKYAKAALLKLGVWEAVKDKTAQAENVRAALALVSRGETPLGIVYGTDSHSDPKVKVLATFPETTHPPIIYPAAETTAATSSDAASFLAFLKSSAARSIFEAEGFVFEASSS
jgi:molybdate transport system substrate-binding protein